MADLREPADPPADPPVTEAAEAALAACPHLVSAEGPWHAAEASRVHRCALLAEGRPTLDRQRQHCLGAAHVTCPTWLEAYGASGPPPRPGGFAVTAPVVLDGPGVGLPADGAARRLAAPVTVVVVGAALGALVLSRGPLAPGTSGAGDEAPSPTPAATVAAGTAAPATAAPTAAPTAEATAAPTARPTPTPATSPATYRVRPGDTLSAIAVRFGTTVRELAALNDISNPSLIRVGQVLRLP
jgi:LysM repeat protein